MSQKNGRSDAAAAPEARTPSTRRWSVTGRLSLWYAVSAFALLAAGTGFLYWVLVATLDAEDEEDIQEKVAVITKIMTEQPQDLAELKQEVEERPSVQRASPVLARVLQSDGSVVTETPGMSALIPPTLFPRVPGSKGRAAHGQVVRLPGGRSYRCVAARVGRGTGDGQPPWLLQVAVDREGSEELIAKWRHRLAAVLVAALVACTLVGAGIARRGMRPVKEMAASLQRIYAATLSERIPVGGLPTELSAMALTFNEMLDRLEEAFARLSGFSADIAHELRTPINNVRGEVEVALSKPRSSEEYREVLSSCLEECVRLSRLIDSLLFLARAEDPKTLIQYARLDVASEFQTLRDFYEASAQELGVTIGLDAAPGITAELDRTLFQRALGNLIENALAHTPAGSRITLSATRQEGKACITVTDTGCGIPAEELPRIFERFSHGNRARTNRTGGHGLGLAMVKRIAALHGGTVEISSTVGVGTRVSLFFPQQRDPSHQPHGPAPDQPA